MVIIFQENIRSVHQKEWKILIDKSLRCYDERRYLEKEHSIIESLEFLKSMLTVP